MIALTARLQERDEQINTLQVGGALQRFAGPHLRLASCVRGFKKLAFGRPLCNLFVVIAIHVCTYDAKLLAVTVTSHTAPWNAAGGARGVRPTEPQAGGHAGREGRGAHPAKKGERSYRRLYRRLALFGVRKARSSSGQGKVMSRGALCSREHSLIASTAALQRSRDTGAMALHRHIQQIACFKSRRAHLASAHPCARMLFPLP